MEPKGLGGRVSSKIQKMAQEGAVGAITVVLPQTALRPTWRGT